MRWAQYDLETGIVLATTERAVIELPPERGQIEVPEGIRIDRILVNPATLEIEAHEPPEAEELLSQEAE